MPNLQYVSAEDDFYRVKVRRTIDRDGKRFVEEYYIGPHTNLGRLKGEVTRQRKRYNQMGYDNAELEPLLFEKMSKWEEIEVD